MTFARWSLVGFVALSGCSSGSGGSDNGNGKATTAPAGTATTAPTGTATTAPDGAPPAGTATTGPTGSASVQTAIGPIPLQAGEEKTVCIVKKLPNEEDVVVSNITADLAPGSHHLIVSTTDATEENLTPTPCQTFSSILMGQTKPLIIVNTPHGVQTFPSGVGVLVPTHQMVRLEGHYLNSSTSAIQGAGTVTFNGVLAAQSPAYQAANTYVWGTAKISLAADATFTTPVVFQPGMPDTHVLSITTHEHRLGTLVQAWTSSAPGAKDEMLANDSNWSEPTWKMLDTPYDLNGANGLSFQCSWNNTTSDTITFGESALQEMCFLIGFYYPSHGLDVCIDGFCLERQKQDGGTPAQAQ